MATTPAYLITQRRDVYSQNLLPTFLTFNKNVPYTGWNIVSGSGVAANDDALFYKGDRGLYLFSTNDSVPFEVNSGGTETRFTATQSKRHILQFWVNNPALGINDDEIIIVKIAKNGAGAWKEISVNADQLNGITDQWVGFYYDFLLDAGDYLDFSFVLPANNRYPVGGSHAVYLDGLKLECDDRNLGYPSVYSEPFIPVPAAPSVDGFYLTRYDLGYPTIYKCLEGSATLDFGSIGHGDSAELTITVAGAKDGDFVNLSVPFASQVGGTIVFARVSSADTITVTYHNASGGSINPASGTYRVFIIPFVP